MKNIENRLSSLKDYLKTLSADKTTFIVQGGGEFHTDEDAIAYMAKHGAYTPDGRRIVLYPHPVDGLDALSASLYQLIDEAVETGRLVLEVGDVEGQNTQA